MNSAVSKAPNGFAKMPGTEKFYRPFSEMKKFHEALKTCRDLGATLMEFQTEAEFKTALLMHGIRTNTYCNFEKLLSDHIFVSVYSYLDF